MKLRSIVAGAVAATSFAAPVMATPQGQFPDVQPTNWAYQAILNLKERYGCAEGFPDGTFRPGEPATRAQMAALTNHCLSNIVEFYTAADAALAAALRAEYGPRLTALEVEEQRRNYQIGNYVGLGFTGYSDDSVDGDYTAGATIVGRARVYQWDNNAAISLRPELTFNDNNQTLLGGAVTFDYPLSRKTLEDGSTVATWNVNAGVGVGGAVGAAEGSYNMYGENTGGYAVVGTEARLSDSFVAFANVKFPFQDNSVNQNNDGQYSPVGTVGLGFKF